MTDTVKPSLRFFYSDALQAKTIKLLTDIEQAEDPKKCRDALGNLIVELTDTGMGYYFLEALNLAKVGFVTKQTANLGMSGAVKIMGSVIRQIIGGMDREQVLIICGYIRQLMQ